MIADSHRDVIDYCEAQIALNTKAASISASTKITMLEQEIEDKREHQRALILTLDSYLDELWTAANREFNLSQNRLRVLEGFVNQ